MPNDWKDGTELRVEKFPSQPQEPSDELERWMAKVQRSAEDMDAEDELVLEKTIRTVRQQARELARANAGNV